VSEEPGLDVVALQRTLEQRVLAKVDLTHGQVVVGPPPRVQRRDLLLGRLSQPGE
jgi:hypothetical protein